MNSVFNWSDITFIFSFDFVIRCLKMKILILEKQNCMKIMMIIMKILIIMKLMIIFISIKSKDISYIETNNEENNELENKIKEAMGKYISKNNILDVIPINNGKKV